MKRSLLAIALLACTVPEGSAPDASLPVSVTVMLLDGPIIVARGESAKIRISIAVSSPGARALTIGLGPLPTGISAPPVTWSTASSTQPTIVVSASPDAPQAQLAFEVRVSDDGAIIGSTSGHMSISNVVGSPDPQFGTNGLVELDAVPLTQPVGIAPAANGTFVIGGFDDTNRRPVVIRILADGTLDSSYANKGVAAVTPSLVANGVTSIAAASDGRLAIALWNGTAGEVDTIDANGSAIATVPIPFMPMSIAWDGDGMFVGGSGGLAYIDATQTVTTTQLQVDVLALEVVTPSTVLAGEQTSSAVIQIQKWIFSTTFDPTGTVTIPLNARVSALATDPSGYTLAAVAGTTAGVARLDPNGLVDTAYGTNGVAIASPSQTGLANVLPTADGKALLLTTVPSTSFPMGATLLARLTSNGEADATFGTYGATTIGSASGTRAAGLALDADASHVYVTGMVDRNGVAGAYIARYRLAP